MSQIAVRAIDLDTEEQQNPTFAEFSFFGKQGEIITGQNVDLAVANAAGRVGYTPPEIEELPGKTFIVTVTPHHQSLDAEFFYFQVQATELLHNDDANSRSTVPVQRPRIFVLYTSVSICNTTVSPAYSA